VLRAIAILLLSTVYSKSLTYVFAIFSA